MNAELFIAGYWLTLSVLSHFVNFPVLRLDGWKLVLGRFDEPRR